MGVPLRVLLVEDSEDDALLIVRQLRGAGYEVAHERVDTPATMQAALTRQTWDLVISDYSMPRFSGTAALMLLQERGVDVPFIFVSGTIGEDVAVAAMKAGASDYVLKDKLKRLVPAIERELKEAESRRERRRAQETLVERTRLAELSSDIGVALTGVAPLQATLEGCAKALVRHLDATSGCIWTFDDHGQSLDLQASAGLPSTLAEAYSRLTLEHTPIGRIARERRPMHSSAVAELIPDRAWVVQEGIAAFAGYPLLVEDRVAGVLAVFCPRPLPEFAFEAVGAVAHQLAVGIERRRAEEQLRQSQERFSKVFRASPIGIAITTEQGGQYVDVNDAFLALVGYERKEVIGRTAFEIGVWRDPAVRTRVLDGLRERGTVPNVDLELQTKGGDIRVVLGSFERIDLDGRPCLLSLVHDISERQLLEEQLRQAQRMEAVGRLAGGVAHDFNNLLSVIIGYCDLLFRRIPPDAPERADLQEIRGAADGASGLTRQLLAFSRRQVLEPRLLDLNAVVANARRLLERVLGEDVELVMRLAPTLPAVRADAGQLDQVLMNLAVNARDAMPDGGKIFFETKVVDVEDAYARGHSGARPGTHVLLAVRDTGVGMDQQTQAHIFEPFFTTKQVGKGTGLGLATVYGIVKQSGGFVEVSSELDQGATFEIYLPPAEGVAEAGSVPEPESVALRGTETVLVVEDSPQLRTLVKEVLAFQGYEVLEAASGNDALQVARQHGGHIDLLVTDVIMPGMNGPQLADQLTAQRPGLKVLFASGHSTDAVVRFGIEAGTAYLQKPFTPDLLARKVREILA
ncbi:MAG: response regulator [Gemmatimonadales bacterium]